MGDFEWANEVCPRCDKAVYQGDWVTRCRCNGSMLRAEVARIIDERDSAARCHVMAIERWLAMCDAVLDVVIEGGDLGSVIDVVTNWLDGSDSLDEATWQRIERARSAADHGRSLPDNGHAIAPPEADQNGRSATRSEDSR